MLPQFDEACYLGLAPTSSTTAVLCYGDALAVVASGVYGFKDVDFGKFHPAGALGKKLLLKVNDLMDKDENNAMVYQNSLLTEAIMELSEKALGIVSVVDEHNTLLGVITDGDLRRQLNKKVDVYNLSVDEVMTRTPKVIETNKMAINALQLMKDNNIAALPVVDEKRVLIGIIRLQSILNAGIV